MVAGCFGRGCGSMVFGRNRSEYILQGDLSAMEISILLLYRDGGNIIQRSHSLFHRRAANADLFYAPVGYGYGSSQFHYRNENSGVSDNSGAVFVGYGCVDASFLSDQCEQFLFFNSSRAAVQQYIHYSDYFIIQNDGSSFYVYKAMKDVGSIVFEQIASISRSYRRQQFASFASNDKLYFVQHSGTNSASQFITVSTGPDAEGNYTVTSTNTVNGMEAEAFFTLNDSITYMLSKNHGLFKVENSSLVKL